MRTSAMTAALVTALTGTGCIVSSTDTVGAGPTGTAHVYWSFDRAAPAQPGGFITYDGSFAAPAASGTAATCPESFVDTVRVISAAGTFDIGCTGRSGSSWVQGAVVDFLPAGPNTIDLVGYRQGQAVYHSSVDVAVPVNGVGTAYAAVQGVSAPLDAFAYLAFGTPAADYLTCGEALFPNFTVDLFDVVAGTLIDHQASGCSNPLPALVFRGPIDLDDYTVRMRGFDAVSGAQVFDSCDVSLAHFASQVGTGGFTATLYTSPMPVCSTP